MSPALKAFLILVVLATIGVVGYFGYKRMPAAGGVAGGGGQPGVPSSSGAGGDIDSTRSSSGGSGSSRTSGTSSAGSSQVVQNNTQSLGTVQGIGFPLQKVTGAALHVSNPFVKDLQQFLNKSIGADLDIDGAFGSETEAAVMKAFGSKSVSKEQYNTSIAPSLGKSFVV